MNEALVLVALLAAATIAVTFVRALQINTGHPDPYHGRFDLRAEIERLCNEQAERQREIDRECAKNP